MSELIDRMKDPVSNKSKMTAFVGSMAEAKLADAESVVLAPLLYRRTAGLAPCDEVPPLPQTDVWAGGRMVEVCDHPSWLWQAKFQGLNYGEATVAAITRVTDVARLHSIVVTLEGVNVVVATNEGETPEQTARRVLTALEGDDE